MSTKRRDLKAKAQGFVESIREMPDADRRYPVSDALAEDYNALLVSVAEAFQDIESILPPMSKRSQDHWRPTYNEIAIYCKQIALLLAEQEEP